MQATWERLNRAAHEEFVAIVKDKQRGNISTSGGEVTLELPTRGREHRATRRPRGRLRQKLPPDAGSLTVLKSDQLGFAQDLVDLIEKLVIILLVLGLGLYGLALYLSRGRRRETLRAIGLIFVAVGVLLLIMRSFAGNIVVDELAKTATVEAAADDVWAISTSLLFSDRRQPDPRSALRTARAPCGRRLRRGLAHGARRAPSPRRSARADALRPPAERTMRRRC